MDEGELGKYVRRNQQIMSSMVRLYRFKVNRKLDARNITQPHRHITKFQIQVFAEQTSKV